MRQVGILAAAGLYAIEHNMERLIEDHEKARLLAEGLDDNEGFKVDLKRVQTNIIIVDISGTGKTPEEMMHELDNHDVLALPFGPRQLRFVTHLDVSMEECKKALEIIEGLKL